MDGVGHMPPRRLRPRVGGQLACGVVVPNPTPPVHPHGVVPAGGRRPLQEREAAARAEQPTGRGVVPLLHAAGPGLPPQRLARLLPPHGAKVLAPRVREAAAAGIEPGGAREEDPVVPPLQGLAHSGPLGPELGSTRENDGGDPDRLVLGPVTAVPPSVRGPRRKFWSRRTPGSSPTRGARAQALWAPPHRRGRCGNTRTAWRHHQRTRERPWCRRWCPVRMGEGAGAARPRPRPRPLPRPRPRCPRAMCKTVGLQVDRGPSPAAGGRELGGGGQGASRAPPPWAGSARRPPVLPVPAAPRGGGEGADGGRGDPRSPSRPRLALGGAAAPRRLCPLLYRQPPTAVWGPSPLPGLHPSPKEDPGPSPRAGAPSWAVGVYTPSGRPGGPVPGASPTGWRRGWYRRYGHRRWHRVRPAGSRASGSCSPPPPRGSSPPFWAATLGSPL